MSNEAYERAKRQKLMEELAEKERREFINFVEDSIGAFCGADCDAMINNMSDEEFKDYINNLKKKWRRKRNKKPGIEELEEQYQYVC